MPGHPSPPHPEFDHRELGIVAAIRTASYKLNSLKLPSSNPVPLKPGKPFGLGPGSGAVAFAGAAWARSYEVRVWSGREVVGTFVCEDSTKEGEMRVQIGRGRLGVDVRGVGVEGQVGEWGDRGEMEV